MLPGVPAEMQGLLTTQVLPRLVPRVAGTVVRSRTLRTTGIPESTLAERVSDIEDTLAPVTLAYLPGLGGVDLRFTAWNLEPREADRLLDAACNRLSERLGRNAYGTGETDLAEVLLAACRERGLTVAVAESCTGGMVAERITEIPGSSEVFLGGVIAYANPAKERLGVSAGILAMHGAVSEESVHAMAGAVRDQFGSDLAVAVSGIAGPGGGSEEKPVGTVWFGFADRQGVVAERYVFPGTRHDIRARATQFALHGLLLRALSAGA
jgi:nicotinamide-nucleotide amidase